MSSEPPTSEVPGVEASDAGAVLAEPRPGPRWPVVWWDAFMLVAVVLMSLPWIVDLATGEERPGRVVLDVACLLAFVLLYLALGRSSLMRRARDETPAGTRDYVFVGLLIALLALSAAVRPSFATLQTLGFPMLWVVLSNYRQAVIGSGILAFAVGCGSVVSYSAAGMETALWTAGMVAALSFAFAVTMGTWISRVFDRGEGYRVLAERLRTSQAEVAALSEQAGASAERERISRELHDTLTQTLTGLVMLGEQAERALDSGDVIRAKERLARVQATSRAAVQEARALVATTHPLGDGGLEQAIERVAAGLRGDAALEVRCELARLPLEREQQVVLLRAVQEGLSNVRRHARARSAIVALQRDGDDAVLTVEDDGVGPGSRTGVEHSGQHGFGLSGLRERLRIAGGEASFAARDGGGSRLEVRLPLEVRSTVTRDGGAA